MDHVRMRTPMMAEMGRPLIQWRAVFGGALLGLASMILLTSLWLAVGFGGDVATVRTNMDWYLGGSAIFAMLLGGFLAGWLSGIRGPMVGMVNGSTVWALVLITTMTVGVPAAIGRVSDAQITTLSTDATWVAFWSLLIGFGTAAIGGLLGGLIPRVGAATAGMAGHEEHEHDHDDERERALAEQERREAERNREEAERLERESARLREEAERRRKAS